MDSDNRRVTRRTFLKRCLFVGAAIVAPIDAAYYEPRNPELVTQHVGIPLLPKNLDGFRIVQLSDLHRRIEVPDAAIRNAVRLANSTKPDAVVLTGDYIGHNILDIDPCFDMLAELKTKSGIFGVLGNHDHWTDSAAVTQSMVDHGVFVLDNCCAELAPGLFVVGIDDEWAGNPDVDTAYFSLPDGAAHVALSHNPQCVNRFKGRNCILLTGHTHGGQINIPPIPRKYLPGLSGAPFIKGWYQEDDVLMYVNRGIGMVNPAIRFFCRPEVTLLVLHPTPKPHPHVIRG